MKTEDSTHHYNWSVRDGIGILMLENPPGNCLEQPEFMPIAYLKNHIGADALKGVIISGEGRHFSAGAKMQHLLKLASNKTDLRDQIQQGKELLLFIENLDIPVVSAIKGTCFGGGLEIALSSHIRICSPNALFAFPETNQSLIPGLGGTVRLNQLIRYPEAMKMILSGDIVNAEEALEIGLVDKISKMKDPFEEALLLLQKIIRNKPIKVINAVMQALRNTRELSFTEAMKEETKIFCELASDEAERRKSELTL